MPKFVSCGEVSWYMLLPFAVAIITSLHYLILQNLFVNGLRHQLFLYSGINSIGKMSMGFLHLITVFNSKRRKKKNEALIENEKENENAFNERSSSAFYVIKEKSKNSIIIIGVFVCALFHYLFFILDNSFRFIRNFALAPEEQTQQTEKISSKHYGFLFIVLQIMVLSPLNKFILRYPFYKHHILALGLVLFGSLIYMLNLIEDGGDIGMCFFLSGFFLNCFQIVFEKYLMQNKYFSVFQILFHEGYIEFILNIICYLLFYFIQGGNSNITFMGFTIENFTEIIPAIQKNKICIVYLLLYFAEMTVYEVTLEMIFFYLNSNYIYLSEILAILLVWIVEMINFSVPTFFSNYRWSNLTGFFIVLLGALIYNEIIILYVCGLERNTKKEIQTRAGDIQEEEIEIIEQMKLSLTSKILL